MFKTKLFKLIDQADAVQCAGYEICLFDMSRGVYELAYDDDVYWEFEDQEVEVTNGSCLATPVTCDRYPNYAGDTVQLEFFVTRGIEEGDL